MNGAKRIYFSFFIKSITIIWFNARNKTRAIRSRGYNQAMNSDHLATTPIKVNEKVRLWVISAALLALFIGAMDSLIMSAAMPTIIADLGGLDIYSWVYTAYFLARAVALPVFGKLADLFKTKILFVTSIGAFMISSLVAGISPNMTVLIVARVFQGIAAGGNFALVYVVLTDMSPPGKRAKTLSLASFIWGIASVLGPTIGGVIVTYFSWRWVFFINIPICLFSITLLAVYLVEIRPKKNRVNLDMAGVATLSFTIVGLLTLLMLGGRDFGWLSSVSIGLVIITLVSGFGFYLSEKRAREPILALKFFTIRGFSIGNLSVFFSSFAIFSLFAYAPLFIQGALGRSPMQVGVAMLSLSLGWSLGSLLLGQVFYRLERKTASIIGAIFLVIGSGLTLMFNHQTSMTTCFWVFQLVGIGMGFVAISTLLVVQNALDESDLGVATSSNQFARSLGGTIGIGVSGVFVTAKIRTTMDALSLSGVIGALPANLVIQLRENYERLFQPGFQSQLLPQVKMALQKTMGENMRVVFWIVLAASLLCFISCLFLPAGKRMRA